MSTLEQLKDQIRKALPDLDVVIGWEQGYDAMHATPLYIRKEEDVDRLIWSPLCVHSLGTYLTGLTRTPGAGKIGLVVKGCDSRAIVQLTQERMIPRENIVLFGVGCTGCLSHARLEYKVEQGGHYVEDMHSITFKGDKVEVAVNGDVETFDFDTVCLEKCLTCRFPNAIATEHFAGEEVPVAPKCDKAPSLEAFEKLSLDERFTFWQDQMRRCVRCYACRNTCPMCVCRDHCISTSRNPHWVSQETSSAENFMFQMIHTMHLAGRCIECGECQRACPVDLPIMLFRRTMVNAVKNTFDYVSGADPEATPPLLTFKVEEDNIKERGW
ncbi:MAG: 4Fe-4S dicluster domain-containing protein [Halodesulfovibrio sp.]